METRRNSPKIRGRRFGQIAIVAGRLLAITAGVAFAIGLMLLVIAWQLLAWPYRRLEPGRRRHVQREAALALMTALAALLATMRRAPAP